jgi:hypothetical protein
VSKDSLEESFSDTPHQQPILTQRAAIIFVSGLVIALIAGVLAHLAGSKPAAAVLAGGGAFAGAVALLHQLIS